MKCQKFLLLFGCLFLLFGNAVFPQEQVWYGKVIDAESQLPLKGADVYWQHSRQGAITGADGSFRIVATSSVLPDTLVIRFLGYEEKHIASSDFRNGAIIPLTPRSIELRDSVYVRGERMNIVRQEIPHARDVVTFQTIELRGSGEISDVFKSIPSVHIEGNDITGRHIQIRGSDASEVNVYVDGILINALNGENQADLSLVPVESIRKIEVLKGANLSLLGNGAFGGVVYISTKQEVKRQVFLKTRLGSFRSRYYLGEMNLPLGRNLVVRYFGQLNSIEPQIEYFPGEQFSDKTENNQIQSDKQNHHLGVDYFLTDGQISGRLYSYFLDYEKPFLKINRKNVFVAAAYQGALPGIRDVDLQLSYLLGDDALSRESDVASRFTSGFVTRRLNLRVLKKIPFSGNEFQLLGEYVHDELESDVEMEQENFSVPLYQALLYENRLGFAGVAAFRNHFDNRPDLTWNTHLGLRGDFVATGDSYISPTMGFQIEIRKPFWTITPYMNYGKNVKIQTLQDNAFVSLLEIDAEDTSLVRLEPEVSNAYEVGVRAVFTPPEKSYQSIDFSLALFRNTQFNKLLRRPFDPLTVNSQIGRNRTFGVEGSVRFGQIIHAFDVTANFTYLNISNPLLYAYKPQSKISLRADTYSEFGFYFSATLFFEGASRAWYYDIDNQLATETIGSFYDVDVALGYKFQLKKLKGNLQLSGVNILDNSGYRFYLLKKRFLQAAFSVRL